MNLENNQIAQLTCSAGKKLADKSSQKLEMQKRIMWHASDRLHVCYPIESLVYSLLWDDATPKRAFSYSMNWTLTLSMNKGRITKMQQLIIPTNSCHEYAIE